MGIWLLLFSWGSEIKDFLDVKTYKKIKGAVNWIRDAPIHIDSLIVFMALGSSDKNKFDTLTESLKNVGKFGIEDMKETNIARDRTLLVSRGRLHFKLSLYNTPTPPPELRDNLSIRIELLSTELSYRNGIKNLKTDLNEIIATSKTVFNSKAKINYRMRIKNIKNLNLKDTNYNVHIYGSKASIESKDINHLEKLIAITN
jgi:hypothetical protein